MDSAFADLVERKKNMVSIRFEKASLQIYLTQDYFEALSKTRLKARIGENNGKIEINFDIKNLKNHDILEELIIFGKILQDIKIRKSEEVVTKTI